LISKQRLRGFKFGINLPNRDLGGGNGETNNLLNEGQGSKLKSMLNSALSKKLKGRIDNDSIRKDSIDATTHNASPVKEGSQGPKDQPGTLEGVQSSASPRKSFFNFSLLKALNKFRTKSTSSRRRDNGQTVKEEISRLKSTINKNKNESIPRQTIVGRLIIDKNTKILILLVLLMMVSAIVFTSTLYDPTPDNCSSDTVMIQSFIQKYGIPALSSNNEYKALMSYTLYNKFPDMELIDYNIPGYGSFQRTREYWDSKVINCTNFYTESDGSEGILHLSFSTESYSFLSHILNISKMIFLIIVLFLGSYMFTLDANRLILLPIENILGLVNLIAKNPDLSEQLIALQAQDKNTKMNEFKAVEHAILKLGKLLVLVFGRAGNNVLYQNISNLGSQEIDLETIGTSNMAIFGFCSIRHFQDLTEVLQEDIMPFVNNISKVVHNSVVKFMGSANKNIGDCFLLVWNLPEECLVAEEENNDGQILSRTNIFLERYAESALASFVDIIIQIASNKDVQIFAEIPAVQKSIPNFRVKLGFGLHMGWAIEGAIGSGIKIDTSYLSPNVNISSRLEAATKKYNVPLLMSNQIFNVLSQKTKNYCRKIDCVTLKGSEEPVSLYTVDLDPYKQSGPKNPASLNLLISPSQHQKALSSPSMQLSMAELREKYLNEDFSFSLESLVPQFLIHYPRDEKFYALFQKAVQSYIAGRWHQARELLESCLIQRPKDGPTTNLLEYVSSSGCLPPAKWQGVRQLVDK
jgi:class 3 adenylate cyclase